LARYSRLLAIVLTLPLFMGAFVDTGTLLQAEATEAAETQCDPATEQCGLDITDDTVCAVPDPNASCTGAGAPKACCTGAGTGTCPAETRICTIGGEVYKRDSGDAAAVHIGGVALVSADPESADGTSTLACTVAGELVHNTTSGKTWVCINATTEDWDYAGESKAIDAFVDFTGLSSLAAMQAAAASLRPYLVSPQTDSNRNVVWRGPTTWNFTDMKTYGTTDSTAVGVLIAPVGALDGNSLPAVDCTRDISSGYLTIHLDDFRLTLNQTGQTKLTHGVKLSAGDLCGWSNLTTTDSTTIGRLVNWLIMDGSAQIGVSNNPADTWQDNRIPLPVAMTGHSTTTTVLWANTFQTGADLRNLDLHLNCNGATDDDNIGFLDIRSFSTAYPRIRVGACGTDMLVTGGGGRMMDLQWGYIGTADVGLAFGNEFGAQSYVAADCVQGGAYCTNTRPTGNVTFDPPRITNVTIEGNDFNVVSVADLWIDPGYVEGEPLIIGAGFRSDTLEPCCEEPAGAPTCNAPEEATMPAGAEISYYPFTGGHFAGVLTSAGGGVDSGVCFGPGANRGRTSEVDFSVEGWLKGSASAFTGGAWDVATYCTGSGAPWACCSGAGAGTCRAPYVDASRLVGEGTNWVAPASYTGTWIDADPNIRRGDAFPTVAVNDGELFVMTNGQLSGTTCDPSAGTSTYLCQRQGASWVALGGAGGGDMVLASIQTVTGAKTFGSAGAVGKLILAGNTSGSTILNAGATASGTATLPAAGGTLMSGTVGATTTVACFDGTGLLACDGGAATLDANGDLVIAGGLTTGDRTTAPGNFLGTPDNDVDLTPNPSCADSGLAGEVRILDSNEAAGDQWDVCDGISLLFRYPPVTTTATEFVAATTTSGAYDTRVLATGDLPSGAALDADTTKHCETFSILDPVDADDHYLGKAQFTETVTDIDCIAEGGGTITLTVRECTSTGTTCGDTEAAITCDSDGAADAGGIDDDTVDAGDWKRALYSAPTGTVTTLSYTVCFTRQVVQ